TDHEQVRVDYGLGVAIRAGGIVRDAGSREAGRFTELGIQIQWVGVPGPILHSNRSGGTLRGYRITDPQASQIRSADTDRRHGRSNGYASDPPRAPGRDHIVPACTARGRSVHAPRNNCERFKTPWENHPMSVRLLRSTELSEVTEMMRTLWSDAGDYDFGDETVFVWERSEGGLGGLWVVLVETLGGGLLGNAGTVHRGVVGCAGPTAIGCGSRLD